MALLLWGVFQVLRLWNTWSLDASALYFSAYFYSLGEMHLVYSPDSTFFGNTPPQEWLDIAHAQGGNVGDFSKFVYPPLWAALLAPIAKNLTAIEFFNLVTVVNVAATILAIYLAYRLLRPQILSFWLWVCLSIALVEVSLIGRLAFQYGQPQVFVSCLIIAAFTALLFDRNGLAGALLGFAAALKIAPGFLVVIFCDGAAMAGASCLCVGERRSGCA